MIGRCGKKAKNAKPPCGVDNEYEGYCVKKCPAGYRSRQGKCYNCPSTCSSCDQNGCVSCNDSSYLSNGLCINNCEKNSMFMKNSSSPLVRLVAGQSSLEGVVEVYHDGSWGTICSDGWNNKAAKVLCKELKLGDVIESKIVRQDRFKILDGYKDTDIWLSQVDCKGSEQSILQCRHKGNLVRIYVIIYLLKNILRC